MSETLRHAIENMSSHDSEARVAAATEIHREGRGLADHAVYPWWAEQELANLLGAPNPFVTVGLAVQPARFQQIREAAGLPRLAEVPPDQDAREFEMHLPGGLSIDILTSREPDGSGAIAKFLQKFGEGIQQVEFRCEDVDRATEILRGKFGLTPVYPQTRPGADGTRVNFYLLSAPGASKVLVELYEPAPHVD
jgi:methylmalonyl-CoA/ethylmalonyl-CoA epimerase